MKTVKTDHRNPIELAQDTGYYTVSGTVNLFLVKQSPEPGLQYRRHFLMHVEEGTEILGAEALLPEGCYRLVAVGCGSAQLQAVPICEMAAERERIDKWQAYLYEKAKKIERLRELQEQQSKEKRLKDAALLGKAVNWLAGDTASLAASLSGSIYMKACRIAAAALSLEINEPKALDESGQPDVVMKAYLQKTNLKHRRVILEDQWWKYADHVMIAFKTDRQPVVLAPKGESYYQMIEPESGITMQVDEKTAEGLLKKAFMIYCNLPGKVITGNTLLRFGLKRITKQDRMLFLSSFAAIGLLGMVIPLMTGVVVDWIIPQGDFGLLFQMGVMLAAVALTMLLFNLTRDFLILRIEGKLDASLQTAVWDRLLNLPLSFFKQFTSAELATRALGITMIRDALSGPALSVILTGIYSLFSWLVLFYYHIPLAVVASLLLAVCIAVNLLMAKQELVFETRISLLTDKLAGLSFQMIKGSVKLQHAGAVERAYYKWAGEQEEKHKTMLDKGVLASWMEAFNGLYLTGSAGILYYLVTMKPTFSLPVGHFVGFNAAYMIFISAAFSIFSSMHAIFQVLPLYQRGKAILETLPEHREDKLVLGEVTGKISIDHVHFRYHPEGAEILKDISLEIKPGEYVGIVGTSGSGKSTLMRLLLGFETAGNGKIAYDDHDIHSIDLRELRKKIGVVLQNGKLITGSIYQNIVGAHLQLTMEDAWTAARIAGIDEDIKAMPMGMHTVVMEGAGTISGGQKQRILIARAVANKPRVLFFDEATSALDNITQAKIQQSLDRFSATRIVIAHRLSTVKNCDRIIVLDHGEIKEMGSYEVLMRKKGVFYAIAERQLA